MAVKKLMTVKTLAKILGVTIEALYGRIRRGNFPEGCILSMPTLGNKNSIRIDIDNLSNHYPGIRRLLYEKEGGGASKTMYTLDEFSKKLSISKSTMRRRINDGTFPFVELPGNGELRVMRIDAVEFVRKFPHFKSLLSSED
ncbi:MAG: hypothetical protein O2963_00050 [Proteobacteria bacterium]|nr:hypothetical protein [Pseudomonadota bacterium]